MPRSGHPAPPSAPASKPPAANAPADLDPATIDALYGLEPVIEPDAPAGADGLAFVTVECPYCWEPFGTTVDLTAGSTSYVEDCQVCCQPIELALEVDDDGALRALRPQRLD